MRAKTIKLKENRAKFSMALDLAVDSVMTPKA